MCTPSDIDQTRARIARSVEDEFVDMDATVDRIRSLRNEVISVVMDGVRNANITNPEGNGVAVVNVALKALSDAEKSVAQTTNAKLRMREQESASAASEIIINALRSSGGAPGTITEDMKPGEIDPALEHELKGKITEGMLRTDNRDFSGT